MPLTSYREEGIPSVQKTHVIASVEYQVSGGKLSENRRYLEFTNGIKAGVFWMGNEKFALL